MVDRDRTVSRLHAQRKALLDQLDAVDRALAALTGAGVTGVTTRELETQEAAEEATSPVVPTRVKPPRMLSDEHRQALIEGRRKARHSTDVAAGRARDIPDPSPGLAPASAARQLPRLVKRPTTLASEAKRTRP